MIKSDKTLLKNYSYYNTGGGCKNLCLPSSFEEAKNFFSKIIDSKEPYFILGGGSNSLVWDGFFEGSVINFSKMNRIEILENGSIYCEAGADNTDFSVFAFENGYSNAGWMNRLPGQMGGTVRMNARCYGGEISQIVTKVHCLDFEGNLVEREDETIFRGYKDTIFMDNGDLILAAEIKLPKGSKEEIKKLMDHCESDRKSKDQFIYPSCGCVFKNDYSIGLPSGLLLEKSGVSKLSFGGAEVSSKHCNFVYNKSATSSDIINLTFKMRDEVWDKFGVWLEYEMEILGTLPKELAEKFNEKREHQPNQKQLSPLLEKFKR